MNPKRIVIATPTDGDPKTAVVTHGYHQAVRQLERAGAVIIPSEVCFSDDLARARSRCVWYCLQNPAWDWLLFWDDDVVPQDTSIIPRMIEVAEADDHWMIAAPYPRKRIPAQFPYKPLDEHLNSGDMVVKNDCIEVEFIACGFMLIRRKCLDHMCAYYEEQEWFTDVHDVKNIHETVALFRQVMTPETALMGRRFRELYSEDYSFCYRWRRMGGKIQMYVGPGSPLGHVGGHMFVGERNEIGRVR